MRPPALFRLYPPDTRRNSRQPEYHCNPPPEFTTDLQRQEWLDKIDSIVAAEFIGKWVQWTGTVADVDRGTLIEKLYVKFRHKPKSGSNVTVYFDEADKDTLLKLNVGTVVTYRGRTSKLGGWMSNHELVGGEIVALEFGQAQVSVR